MDRRPIPHRLRRYVCLCAGLALLAGLVSIVPNAPRSLAAATVKPHHLELGTSSSRTSLRAYAPGYYEAAKLTAADVGVDEAFATDVALSGNTALIGDPNDDDLGTQSGSAYVFDYDPLTGVWTQVAQLNASDAGLYDNFGISVALVGDTAFVGAPFNSPGGVVYVFEREHGGPNAWGEARQIKGNDTAWGDAFGISVDISADTLVVGAYAGGNYDGSAYVFEHDEGGPDQWGQVSKLVPSENPAYNYFGYAVAISGNTVVAGAPGNDYRVGAAHVFERENAESDIWLEVTQLIPDDGVSDDWFGIALDLAGDTAIVGAPGNLGRGAAYLFERDWNGADAWGQVAKLTASDGLEGDSFGGDVVIHEDVVMSGAPGKDAGTGVVYVYGRHEGGEENWGELSQLTASDGEPFDSFGGSLALEDATLIAGAPGDEPGGVAYVFLRNTPPAELILAFAPHPVIEGEQAFLVGGFSDPDAGESHAVKINWGDGSVETLICPPETRTFSRIHPYLDDLPSGTPTDTYTLTVTITDTHSGTAWGHLPVVVDNVPPVFEAGPDATIQAGDALYREGSFGDPGADSWAATVDYGDAGGALPLDLEGQAFALEHLYTAGGIYPVIVTISDDDAGQYSDQFLVTVLEHMYTVYLPYLLR